MIGGGLSGSSARVRYVLGPPRPVWRHQSTGLGELCRLVVSDWSGRSRNILNSTKNILNKAKNGKILFLGAKNFFSTHPYRKSWVFKKRVFRPLARSYAELWRFLGFWPIFCQFLRSLLGLVWDNQAGLDRYGSMVLYRRNSCAQRAYLEAELSPYKGVMANLMILAQIWGRAQKDPQVGRDVLRPYEPTCHTLETALSLMRPFSGQIDAGKVLFEQNCWFLADQKYT